MIHASDAQYKSGMHNQVVGPIRDLAGTPPSENGYAERILRRRRICVGKRKPKPMANVIGIAINTRVRVEVVEMSPTKIPSVNVVGLPFGNFAETTTR